MTSLPTVGSVPSATPAPTLRDLLDPNASRLRRPLLRSDAPLVWRPDGRPQCGAEGTPLTAPGPEAARWLLGLDGLRTWAEIESDQRLTGQPGPDEAARLVNALTEVGALADAATLPAHWRWVDRAHRVAEAGDRASLALALADPHAADAALERRHATRVAVIGTGLLANEMRSAIEISGLTLDERAPTVRVLARSGPPDVFTDPTSTDYDLPHLPVAIHGPRGLVGPLVVPGSTGCLRCRHLHRIDADPAWPAVSLHVRAALRGVAEPIDRLHARALATQATILLRRWVDQPAQRHAWADLAIELDLGDGLTRVVGRPPHPLCGCRWSASVDVA